MLEYDRSFKYWPLVLLSTGLALSLGPLISARTIGSPGAGHVTFSPLATLSPDFCPRIADPKLPGGEVPISFFLSPPTATFHLTVGVSTQGQQLVRLIFSGEQSGSGGPITYYWDGKDHRGRFVDPGAYQVHVVARDTQVFKIDYPVNIVRLGLVEIEAQPSVADDEWQMVYFRKNGAYRYFATPAIHEYVNSARDGEISDLDLDDGTPRPMAPLHLATDEPVMDGSAYEAHQYNYPLCYLMGTRPRFEVTMGRHGTSWRGVPVPVGYPIPGVAMRGLARDGAGAWESHAEPLGLGARYVYVGPALPNNAGRTDRTVEWSWQYRVVGDTNWIDIPGILQTDHRFYTIVNTPSFRSGVSGTQYTGPWVEVAEYLHTFADGLGLSTTDEAEVNEAFIRGYFGQDGALPTAIEGVMYDTVTVGGDHGATRYYLWTSETIRLSRLLNAHALGVYVNCSDVAATTSTMLGMLGVQNTQMVYLGRMYLRAIWGVGCPDYTLDLWGDHDHDFSYHHIMTREAGVTVSDACMWLDEDGNPDSLPGIPGQNCDRPWSGADGYNALSSTNNVSKSLDVLPKIN